MVTDLQLQKWARSRAGKSRCKLIGETVAIFQKRLTGTYNAKLSAAQELWPELVGPELAEETFPSALRNGTLIVTVAHTAAKFTIEQLLLTALLEQMHSSLGGHIRQIRCTLQESSKA